MNKQYKANCRVDKNKGNGIETYPLFLKEANNDDHAHEMAKYYILTTFPKWALYNIELSVI